MSFVIMLKTNLKDILKDKFSQIYFFVNNKENNLKLILEMFIF